MGLFNDPHGVTLTSVTGAMIRDAAVSVTVTLVLVFVLQAVRDGL